MRGSLRLSGIFLALLPGAILTLTVACSRQQAGTPSSSSGSTANKGVIKVRFSHNLTEDAANAQAVTEFKRKLAELSRGRMQVEIYPNQQLGSMREQAEQTQFGSIQITLQPVSVVSTFVPSLTILDLPFLFPDEETVSTVLHGEAGKALLATLEPVNFKGLSFLTQGFKQITTRDFPVRSPEDLKGIPFRVMPSNLLIDTFRAWGANPTPIDFAELYNSLQQRVVLAQENDFEVIYQKRLYEVQKHLIITNHNFLAYVMAANKSWYDGLDDELKTALAASVAHAARYGFELVNKANREILEKLKAAGMVVTELPPGTRQRFIELSQPVYAKYVKTESDRAIFSRIQQALRDAAVPRQAGR